MFTFNSPKRPVGVFSAADVYTLAVHSRHQREITANEMTSNEIKLYRDGGGPKLCIVRATEMSVITGCNRRAKWTARFSRDDAVSTLHLWPVWFYRHLPHNIVVVVLLILCIVMHVSFSWYNGNMQNLLLLLPLLSSLYFRLYRFEQLHATVSYVNRKVLYFDKSHEEFIQTYK